MKGARRGANGVSRRQFVITAATAAGGFALGIGICGARGRASAPAAVGQYFGADERDPREVNAWIVIDPDDAVTLRVSHAELGQGTSTGLSMLIAEELCCEWAKVRCEFASPHRNSSEKVYGQMATLGSFGIRMTWKLVQQAGASARGRLIAAAATRWHVAPGECVAADSQVRHVSSGRAFRYGELAPAASTIVLTPEPAIKTPERFTLAGQPLARLDTATKVNGSAQFGIDTRLPGMVYAAIAMCPVIGGTLVSVDEAPAAGLRGVRQIVKLPAGVAVVADNYWRAERALQALLPGIRWDGGAAATTDSAQFRQMYRAMLDGPMVTARDHGDARAAIAGHPEVIEAVYEVPHLAHATMEPLNATVHLRKERLDVWIGTQQADLYTNLAAKAAALAPSQVFLHNCYAGGGFGRREFGDDLLAAIAIAQAVGDTPVQMIWSREQDMRHGRYRPQVCARFKALLGDDQRPAALHIELALDSIMNAVGMPLVNGVDIMATEGLSWQICYDQVAHWFCGHALKNTHIPAAFWRSVGGSHNGFFLESFVDELAHSAGADPFAFRRDMTRRADVLGVLDVLESKSDWNKPLPKGRGRGVAVVDNHGSIMGMVVEVTVRDDGQWRVERVVAAIDAYHVVNPNLVTAQVEGGFVFGYTAARYGAITVKDGIVEQGNFDTYPMARLADTPPVETHICSSGGVDDAGLPKWGGVGECTVAPVAPALANAIFNATGQRVRRLPLKLANLGGGVRDVKTEEVG